MGRVTWAEKSRSNLDVVFAELDERGRETGRYSVDRFDGTAQTVERPPRRWPYAVAGAAVIAAVEAARLLAT